jgi:hypothetical protein
MAPTIATAGTTVDTCEKEIRMRLQMEITEQQSAHLENLIQNTGLSTKKDLFNNALTLLSWAIDEVRNGNTIAAVNEEQKLYRELNMPVLSHVRRPTS